MCSACALTAMAGVTTLRAWLALRFPSLQQQGRMRAVTVGVIGTGVVIASVSLTGSTPPPTG